MERSPYARTKRGIGIASLFGPMRWCRRKLLHAVSGLIVVTYERRAGWLYRHAPRHRCGAMPRALRRLRAPLVWLSILALLWCQVSAAAGWCGTSPLSPEGSRATTSVMPAGCHHAKQGAPSHSNSCCPVGHTTTDGPQGLANPAIALGHEVFHVTPIVTVALIRATAVESRAPSRPPPHFLGRLLI